MMLFQLVSFEILNILRSLYNLLFIRHAFDSHLSKTEQIESLETGHNISHKFFPRYSKIYLKRFYFIITKHCTDSRSSDISHNIMMKTTVRKGDLEQLVAI